MKTSFVAARAALGLAAALSVSAQASTPLIPLSVSHGGRQHSIQRHIDPTESSAPEVMSGISDVRYQGPLIPRSPIQSQKAPSTPWVALGPAALLNDTGAIGANPQTASGRIAAIATDPTDAGTYYIAAAGGGVWKTTDSGQSYVALTDGQPDTAMGSIVVAPSNHNVIYAGTGEANFSGDSRYGQGLLRSIDGGSSWAVIPGPGDVFTRQAISKVVVDPTNANTVYLIMASSANGVGGNRGVWKSTDGGSSWVNTGTSITTVYSYTDLVIDPNHHLTLYAAVGRIFGSPYNGVYKTTDGGGHWSLIGTGTFPTDNVGRIALAISPTETQTLYASISSSNGVDFGSLRGLFKTTDGGATWTQLTSAPQYLGGQYGVAPGQGWYDDVVVVDPHNANIVFAGGVVNYGANYYYQLSTLVGSLDGGQTWNDYSVGKGYLGPHTDLHALTFTKDVRLLDGNDGGIWRLDNPEIPNPIPPDGVDDNSNILWTDINSDLNTIQFTGVALHPTDASIAYGGSQDNGTEKYTGSKEWTQVQGGDGGFVRVDQSHPDTVYHTFYGISLQRSDDGGQTWQDKITGINQNDNIPGDQTYGDDPSNFYIPYILDPDNQSRVLLGTDHVYESLNRGDSFTPIASPGVSGFNPADYPVDALGVADATIYATAGGYFFVTNNDGKSWAERDVPNVTDIFSDIAVNLVDPYDVIMTRPLFNDFANGHVFRTVNGGKNWYDISGTLPNEPFNAVKLDPKSGILYVGGDDGVYASADFGGSWVKLQSGLPNAQVVDLELNDATGILAAGTHGRGMWGLPLSKTVATPHFLFTATLTRDQLGFVSAVVKIENGGSVDVSDLVISKIALNGRPSFPANGSVGYVPGRWAVQSAPFSLGSASSGSGTLEIQGTYHGGTFDAFVSVTVP